jgi:hypothetical protein
VLKSSLPTFLQRSITGQDSVPKIFGSAFETLMLSLDLTGLEISLSRLRWSHGRLGRPSTRFSRSSRNEVSGAATIGGSRPAPGMMEVD